MIIDIRDRLPSGSGYSGRYDLVLDDVVRRVWHHTVSHISWNTAVNATQAEEIAHLLAIDTMHAAWGLNGFGYHNAAFASGRAYRVGSYDKARAHVASGQNSYSIGTVLIGNFTNALPSEGHLAAAKECRGDIEDFYARKLEGLPHLLVPGQNTACPGARWQEWVPQLEKEQVHMPKTPAEWLYGKAINERDYQAWMAFHALSDEESADPIQRAAERERFIHYFETHVRWRAVQLGLI